MQSCREPITDTPYRLGGKVDPMVHTYGRKLPAFIFVVPLHGCENRTPVNIEHNLWVQKEGKVSPVHATKAEGVNR
jgi:hypothetical protein